MSLYFTDPAVVLTPVAFATRNRRRAYGSPLFWSAGYAFWAGSSIESVSGVDVYEWLGVSAARHAQPLIKSEH